MVLPRRLRRVNRVGLNRLVVHVAPRLPGLGVVVHRGRRSGHVYRTPVMVFRHGEQIVVALPYGDDTDWVRNVLGPGKSAVVTRGRTLPLVSPRIARDPQHRAVPALVRPFLRALGADSFLTAGTVPAAG
ncbi:nitroreductase family deazaflavin-dependent oxidoreductase [Mumia sp. zg.B53]|uniref:nitroreductase family deazaflavin-dependent oxidoreductase n=1 Tax=unclassified Mumia TaxID=2621872 RepID=UPI001C6F29A8|nr:MULTISPECIES: nitroreductase family deazaflavin-dependent oxidoreductase [unclassified Mumia]MBW9211202.1 nitroreductase family deazaflavin-dependent oxidoreductase [Mumia sp. zg.B21]MBW9215777.1 nitroreductase family deazaflavin-dependent oxidoreductase [Mumia sp. zg.B53]